MSKKKLPKIGVSGALKSVSAKLSSGEPEIVEIKTGDTLRVKVEAHPPTIRIYDRLPDDHPFYAIVGRVAAEWARLEHTLDTIIWELSGMDRKTGSCVTGQMMGYRPRMEAIAALAVLKGAPEATVEYINTVKEIVGQLAQRRNRFVHDAWLSVGDGTVAQFVSFSAKERIFGPTDIDECAATSLIADIGTRIDKIKKLHERLRTELAP